MKLLYAMLAYSTPGLILKFWMSINASGITWYWGEFSKIFAYHEELLSAVADLNL